MKFSFSSDLKFHYPFLFLFLFSLGFALVNYSWTELLWSYFLFMLLDSFALGFTMHRVVAHRFIEVPKTVERIGMFLGTLCGLGSPLSWALSHHLHHQHSDTNADPHAPGLYGFKVGLGYFDEEAIKTNMRKGLLQCRHLTQDPFVMFLHQYYLLIILGSYLLVGMTFGLKILLLWVIIPAGLSYVATTMLNYFAHKSGYRNFETRDSSRNVWWMFFLVFGENWHNNHHQFPRALSTRVKWWELDLLMIWVWLFRKKEKSLALEERA